MKQKRSAWMRTRAKRKHVASDRARRKNVQGTFCILKEKIMVFISWKKKRIPVYYKDMN